MSNTNSLDVMLFHINLCWLSLGVGILATAIDYAKSSKTPDNLELAKVVAEEFNARHCGIIAESSARYAIQG